MLICTAENAELYVVTLGRARQVLCKPCSLTPHTKRDTNAYTLKKDLRIFTEAGRARCCASRAL